MTPHRQYHEFWMAATSKAAFSFSSTSNILICVLYTSVRDLQYNDDSEILIFRKCTSVVSSCLPREHGCQYFKIVFRRSPGLNLQPHTVVDVLSLCATATLKKLFKLDIFYLLLHQFKFINPISEARALNQVKFIHKKIKTIFSMVLIRPHIFPYY